MKKQTYAIIAIAAIIIGVIAIAIYAVPNTPVYAYQGSNEIIGYASTVQEAQTVCEDFYRNLFAGTLPLPEPVALAQQRATGGFECLPAE